MQPETQKTGIIYCRVSSAEQVQGTSLAMQERLCLEYAERENIKILAKPFIEKGESAKTADRTEFNKALAFCTDKKNKVDYFIVHKVDRFMRNSDQHGVMQAFLNKYGTKLRSVSEQIDETPMGRAMGGMLAVFAEFDNNVRSARSKSGMVEKVTRGEWVWAAPLGYKRLTKGGNLIVDDEVAPYVQEIFEEWVKGTHSFRSLAEHMNARGFRTRMGKKAGPQLMEKIVRNPAYCGIIRAFGGDFKASFAALIDEALFLQCQPGKRSKFGHGKRLRENSEFPLRKFTVCSECEASLTGSTSTGRGGIKYPYYHHHKQDCPLAKSFPKETLEQNFVEYLQSVSPSGKYEKAFKAIVVDVWQSNYKRLDSENARVRKEIEVLETERQRVFDMHRMGKYNDEEFLEQKNLVNIKINDKKALLNEKQIEEFNMEEALDYCFRFVRQSAKTWLGLKDMPAHRVRFQNQVFPEKVTFDGKKFGTKKLALIYKLNEESGADKSKLVTLTSRNSKPIIEFLQELSNTASKFASLQNKAFLEAQ